MEADLYALCPCGSGKKIKFCKCRDTISDLDRIARMVEGGQMVAALDRTNQVLTEHPDAAWALAIKGRLLLRLRENDKLAENAERFLRLQPSNPLALLQKAAAMLGKGDTIATTTAVLESMSEARETHDALLFEISAPLGMVLAEQGNYLSARAFLAMAAAPDVPVAEMAASVLTEIGQNRAINLLLKHQPETVSPPNGATWGERFEEASRLLEVNSVFLAESKLQALDRQVPGQTAILLGLMRCAIWRADQATQSKLFAKLAEANAVSEEDRGYYRALAYLTEPNQPRISLPTRDMLWNVHEVDATLAALTAHSRTFVLPSDMVRELVFGENEAPPKAAFQLLDRDCGSDENMPPVANAPDVLGMLLFYGRQTDRPAQLLAINVFKHHEEEVSRIVASALGNESAQPTIGEEHLAPLYSALTLTTPAFRMRGTLPSQLLRWQKQYLAERIEQRLMQCPLPLFNGVTVAQAAESPEFKSQRIALARILEGLDQFATELPEALDSIRTKMGVTALADFDAPTGRQLLRVPSYKLSRMKPGSLGAEESAMLIERGRTLSCRTVVQRFATYLLGLSLGGELARLKLSAYMGLSESSADPEVGLKHLEAGKVFAKEHGFPNANFLLSEIGFRLQTSDVAGLQNCINTITTEYRNNPTVIGQLQQILAMYGLINPDGTPRGGQRQAAPPSMARAEAAPPAGGALWTPESKSPSKQEGSKLWIPGMD